MEGGIRMRKKITYIITLVAVSLAAFSIGKFIAETPDLEPTIAETETAQEIKAIETTEYGMLITFGDDTGVFVDTESLENAGMINTANIVDWNTDGEELAVITENDYEYYAYKSENIYEKE